ncbi:unnamed protein product, partial [Porites evermanni]
MEAIKRKIEEVDDIADVTALMIHLNIATKGCKTLQQMIDRICENLKDRRDNLDPNKAFKIIADSQTMEKLKSIKLLQVYNEVLQVVSQLDATFLNLLKTSEGDVPANIKRRMEGIENKEYVVLVAGASIRQMLAVFSGVAFQKAVSKFRKKQVSVLCSRASSTKRENKDFDSYDLSTLIVYVNTYANLFASCLQRQQAWQAICKTLTGYPLSLLTVYRSFAFLLLLGLDFILFALTHCILDFDFFFLSDNFFMIKVTYGFLTYLSIKCFAKTSIAFSISIISLCKRKREALALSFQEKRAQNIFNRLAFHADVLRGSSRKASRKHYFLVKLKRAQFPSNDLIAYYCKSIRSSLDYACPVFHYAWLDRLLDRIIWMMGVFINNIHTQEIAARERLESVMERLEKLHTEQESVMGELRVHLETNVRNVVEELISFLKRQDVVEMFSTWDDDNLPDDEGSWEVIEAGITKLVKTRLQTVIQEWEEEQKKFAGACTSVISFFLDKYSYLAKELRGLEVKVSQELAPTKEKEEGVEDQLFKLFDMQLTLVDKIKLAVMVPFIIPAVLVGLALAMPATLFSLPLVGLKAVIDTIQDKQQKRKYLKNRREFVKAVSLKYLEKVSTLEALQPLIQEQLIQVTSSLDFIERRIPMLIEADMQLCQQLMREEQNKKDVEATYKPKKQECERLRGNLALLGALEIRSMEIAWTDIDWDTTEDVFLQKILPPGIYNGRITKNGDPSRPVNLKVYEEVLTTSNVTECLAADRALRNLRHPHIVQFYGTSFREVPRGVEAVFVTEQCGESLKTYLVEHSGNNPADNSMTAAHVLRWAQQILDALIVVHSMGYVHGDLRLGNVLV